MRVPSDTAAALARRGLSIEDGGCLSVAGVNTQSLADCWGTPLHVVDERGLEADARAFASAFRAHYPADVEVCFALKANPVLGVVERLSRAGIGAEVMSSYELRLAGRAGVRPDRVVVNGPGKTDTFLAECLEAGVRWVVIDSLRELVALDRIAAKGKRQAEVLLRINVAYAPRWVSSGSATASKKSVFGIETGSEVDAALEAVRHARALRCRGFHIHVGSGIREAESFREAFNRLAPVLRRAWRDYGLLTEVLDLGGGFGTPGTRGYSDLEFALYHGLGHLPRTPESSRQAGFDSFAVTACDAIARFFAAEKLPLPLLVLEPGRALSGPRQTLLLRVLALRRRSEGTVWAVTDGGQMTVNFPTFYEYHEILCCRSPLAPPAGRVEVVGCGCYSADYVCRGKPLPELREGDVLAVLDAGAYFTSFEGNFSHPRAAVVGVEEGHIRLLRRRETVEEMLDRDLMPQEAACI